MLVLVAVEEAEEVTLIQIQVHMIPHLLVEEGGEVKETPVVLVVIMGILDQKLMGGLGVLLNVFPKLMEKVAEEEAVVE